MSGKNLEEASKELTEVLKVKPDYYRALYNLGLVQYSQGKADAALETLENAAQIGKEKNVQDSTILNSVGWIQMNRGKLVEAEDYLLKALEQTPNNETTSKKRVLNNLGYLYLQKGDTNRAEAFLEEAVREYSSSGATEVLKLVHASEKQAQVIAAASPTSVNSELTSMIGADVGLLFSQSGAERTVGYERITRTELRKSQALPQQIITAAKQNFEHEAGVRMAVVTLRDMSRTTTQQAANKSLIEAFANEVDAKFTELRDETQSLRKWLATPPR